jgi:hypothetical protein
MTAAIDFRFSSNFADAAKNGIIRGAYHVGLPTSVSSGATQAKYFIANGSRCTPLCFAVFLSLFVSAGWTRDGITLPGAVRFSGTISSLLIPEIVLTPRVFLNSGGCGDLDAAHMIAWIKDFSNTYRAMTTR